MILKRLDYESLNTRLGRNMKISTFVSPDPKKILGSHGPNACTDPVYFIMKGDLKESFTLCVYRGKISLFGDVPPALRKIKAPKLNSLYQKHGLAFLRSRALRLVPYYKISLALISPTHTELQTVRILHTLLESLHPTPLCTLKRSCPSGLSYLPNYVKLLD